jgi:hypothetical protein
MKEQTHKAPTGPYQRQKLLQFLEKKAKEEKDWEQNKPFVKEIRGRSKVKAGHIGQGGERLGTEQAICQGD